MISKSAEKSLRTFLVLILFCSFSIDLSFAFNGDLQLIKSKIQSGEFSKAEIIELLINPSGEISSQSHSQGTSPKVINQQHNGGELDDLWDNLVSLNLTELGFDGMYVGVAVSDEYIMLTDLMGNQLVLLSHDGEEEDTVPYDPDMIAMEMFGPMDVGWDGEYLYGGNWEGNVFKFTPDMEEVENIGTFGFLVWSCGYDWDNDFVYAYDTNTGLSRMDASNGDVENLGGNDAMGGVYGISYMPLDEDGYTIWIMGNSEDEGVAYLYKFNPDTEEYSEEDPVEIYGQDDPAGYGMCITNGYNASRWDIATLAQGNALMQVDIWEGMTRAGNLMGGVTDSETGEPIIGVHGEVIDPEEEEVVAEFETDEEGGYLVEGLSIGTYWITVVAEDYEPYTVEDVEILIAEDTEVNFQLVPIEEYSIEELQTQVDLETWIRTTGVVTLPVNSTTIEYTEFYIQDETGYGIRVYDELPADSLGLEIERGFEIEITGQLQELDGLTYLINFYLEILDRDSPLPDPIYISTDEMANNQEMEGSLGKINAALAQDPPDEANYTIMLDDGTGAVGVRICENTGINLDDYQSGDWIVVEGVIGLDEGNVELVPSLESDVYVIPVNAPYNLEGELIDDEMGIVTLSWEHETEAQLDEFIEFIVYRERDEVGRTTELTYIDTIPQPEESGTYTFSYIVTALYDEGLSETSTVEIEWEYYASIVNADSEIPSEFSIASIYPNPFNSTAEINFELPENALVIISLFNIIGEEVGTISKREFAAGRHSIALNAEDLASGIYFLNFHVPGKVNQLRKVVLIR
ncbi:MAG: carboxypeptidase regulatory-like domain-containing protein [Candidatus Electryonea clarkiae]|nr:carboxypeptidase regulatory-like domain-containing protein [Candidatus Electryonea clarkiae]MDP8286758.1 carboxypeptidase regulatory-like domain-containing protein [Candidatus Electryonea clarkiae]